MSVAGVAQALLWRHGAHPVRTGLARRRIIAAGGGIARVQRRQQRKQDVTRSSRAGRQARARDAAGGVRWVAQACASLCVCARRPGAAAVRGMVAWGAGSRADMDTPRF